MRKLRISTIWASVTRATFGRQDLLCLEAVVVPGLALLGTFHGTRRAKQNRAETLHI